jgi:ABC-type multidrug transport system fused ATPase/permease subunit
VFLVLQALTLFFVHDPIERYNLGVFGASSTFVVIVALILENSFLRSRIDSLAPYTVHIILTAIQLGVAFFSLFAFISLQRRPDVICNGQPVDNEFTTSAISRYSFAWGGPILAYTRQHKGLDFEDLPRVSQYLRANFLQSTFNDSKGKVPLWRQIIWYFRWPFIQQFVLIATIGVTQFGPQFAMYNLLKLLEVRAEGAQVSMMAWVWVIGLGLFMIGTSLLESWLFWIVWSRLGIPIRALLSTLVFMKSTRRKDVKGVQKSDADVAINKDSGPKREDTAVKKDDKKKEDEEEDDDVTKSRQSTINLVGVDSKRVSDFSSYAYIFTGVAVKLTVSLSFIYVLIGWKSLLAGLFAFALSIPLNIWLSKRYNKGQSDLMKLRDEKMAVVTEALQGIRQIKFSALESQWQARIGEKRSKELAILKKIFIYDTGLISLWIFGPIMLSAVSLTVYSWLHGSLSASVAFTTIAIFSQIEVSLAIIPELTTDAVDAWVSIKRIEKYLDSEDKSNCTVPSDAVSFENATIAWPADSQEEDKDRFMLRNINLRFPNKELSVISGKTGSGKSLLLAGILGEVDKISGTIKVPKAPPLHERFDQQATKGNWIIDSGIAYVAQIPWIENATIKDNILFGLPYDEGRYKKVVSVCALEKDLDMLPDGELTDIGANGINLSGGQRWRVSFARALYSRAGILVLDDIFSALDAHVGRQLFEEALTGDLCVGRTRILVTHHVGLCLPKTKYTVLLGEGTIEHAGFVEDLKKTGSLEQILKQEDEEKEIEGDSDAEEEGANGHDLTKVMSRRSGHSAVIDDGGAIHKTKSKPKKFVEEEKRETGSIKLSLYKEYLKSSGGLKVWGVLIVLFLSYMSLILFRSYWISIWTRSYRTESTLFTTQHHQLYTQTSRLKSSFESRAADDGNLWYYLRIYIALSFIVWAVGTIRYFTIFFGSLKASRTIFDKLCATVLRAPLRWLDTVPVGRVLNRFTADFNILDSRIAGNLGFFLYQGLELVGIMIAGFIVSPYMIFFAAALMVIAGYVAGLYLGGAREIKRLESNAKSPIFEQFGSSLAGIGTIRAFDKAEEYIDR